MANLLVKFGWSTKVCRGRNRTAACYRDFPALKYHESHICHLILPILLPPVGRTRCPRDEKARGGEGGGGGGGSVMCILHYSTRYVGEGYFFASREITDVCSYG